MLPFDTLAFTCSIPEWTACSPCRRCWNSGLSLLYASTALANRVSPPVSGLSRMYRKVVPGGCASYETSECQATGLVQVSKYWAARGAAAARGAGGGAGGPAGGPGGGGGGGRPGGRPGGGAAGGE